MGEITLLRGTENGNSQREFLSRIYLLNCSKKNIMTRALLLYSVTQSQLATRWSPGPDPEIAIDPYVIPSFFFLPRKLSDQIDFFNACHSILPVT